MSGPPGTALNMTSDMTEGHTRPVTGRLECGNGSDKEVLKCLREFPMKELKDVAVAYSSADGDIFLDRPWALYKAGKFVEAGQGWTQDDGATNAGSAHLNNSEEDMVVAIARFASHLTPADYIILFAKYNAADFEETVADYRNTKEASDPAVSVHVFRLARILGDVLLTCLSIDFGFGMTKQIRLQKGDWNGVILYDFNQTMLWPIARMGGIPFVGAIHGSDMSFLLNGLFSEGEVLEEGSGLSRESSAAVINFAYPGNPSGVGEET